MKKIKKKLSLKKVSIAQVGNLNAIKGGTDSFEPDTSDLTNYACNPIPLQISNLCNITNPCGNITTYCTYPTLTEITNTCMITTFNTSLQTI